MKEPVYSFNMSVISNPIDPFWKCSGEACRSILAQHLGYVFGHSLILSDDVAQTVYHAACAVELEISILVDLFAFLSPPPHKTGLRIEGVLTLIPSHLLW